MQYGELARVYSITFLNANLFKDTEDFHTTFQILDQKTGKILLTDHLEMHILELSKLEKSISTIRTNLEAWAYFFRKVHKLEEGDLQELRTKYTFIKERNIIRLKFQVKWQSTQRIWDCIAKVTFILFQEKLIFYASRDKRFKLT